MSLSTHPPISLPDLPAWSATRAHAAASSRTVMAGCVASKVIHLTTVTVIYALVASNLLSYSPPSGRQSIQLAASFASAEAAPAVTISARPAEIAPAPRHVAIVSRGELSPVEGNGESEIDLPESVARPPTERPTSRRPLDETIPEPTAAQAATRLTKAVSSQVAASTTTAEPASASIASLASIGAKADSLPTAAFCPEPVYPPALLAARIEGQVVLRLSVAADGAVTDADVERSSGYAAMDEAALAAVRKWKFHPARRFGAPVAIQVRKPLRFTIEPTR